ncbi:MAG: RNA polymerase Rpb4 family protein [Candidatus Aenigmatarchaeota archaeon]
MNLIKEELITNTEAKALLEKAVKPDDMKFEQKNAYENLKRFAKLAADKARALAEELNKNKKLRERQIISIVNMLPEDEDDLRAVLGKDYSNFTPDEISLILDAVRKARTDKS